MNFSQNVWDVAANAAFICSVRGGQQMSSQVPIFSFESPLFQIVIVFRKSCGVIRFCACFNAGICTILVISIVLVKYKTSFMVVKHIYLDKLYE